MLTKRLLSLTLNPKRYFPTIQSRFSTVDDSKIHRNPFLDDNLDDFPSKDIIARSRIKFPKTTVKSVKSILQDHLDCDENEAKKIATEHKQKFCLRTLSEIRTQIETFLENGIDTKIILKYPEIIGMIFVQEKFSLLLDLPRGENGNGLSDYFPLLKLELKDLRKLRKKFVAERCYMPYNSRIHFLSAKLLVEPHVVADCFSKYVFMCDVKKDKFFVITDILLEYKVSSEDILRDPWAFRYSPSITRKRLEETKSVTKSGEKIKPWLGRATKEIFDHTLKIRADTRAALAEVDAEDKIDYLSKRLGYDKEALKTYLNRYPLIYTVRINKLKKMLDFLLNEARFTPQQIIVVPRVMTFGLKRMKEKHQELRNLKYKVSSLIVFCLTEKVYQKFIARVRSNQHYIKQKTT